MRVLPLLAVVFLVAVQALPAHAVSWSLGANLGYLKKLHDRNPDANSVQVLGSSSLAMGGIRLGMRGERSRHELYLDTGFQSGFIQDRQFADAVVTANLLRGYRLGAGTDLFGTIGVGMVTRFATRAGPGGTILSPTSLVGGAGLGLRRAFSQGHGALRCEVRFDRHAAGKEWGVVLLPAASVIGVQVGFDLWTR